MPYHKRTDQLEVYSETQKNRTFVGTLTYESDEQLYRFSYDRSYARSKKAIPIGPDLPLKKITHYSERAKLFNSFDDRIPSRDNPAYADYCKSQGISPQETNPIVLLTTIGRRGPSTFVFEPVYEFDDVAARFKFFRKEIQITIREAASAFDMNYVSLSRIEVGKSKDKSLLKLISIYLDYPTVALEQIRLNRSKLHERTYLLLLKYFKGLENHATPTLFGWSRK